MEQWLYIETLKGSQIWDGPGLLASLFMTMGMTQMIHSFIFNNQFNLVKVVVGLGTLEVIQLPTAMGMTFSQNVGVFGAFNRAHGLSQSFTLMIHLPIEVSTNLRWVFMFFFPVSSGFH